MAEIDQLGQRGDAESVQTLMQLGDTYTYLNFQAIEALGGVKTPEVARYLAGKTHDKDPKIVAGAMQSLAQVQDAEGIPVIAATLAANRQRPDGFQDTVCKRNGSETDRISTLDSAEKVAGGRPAGRSSGATLPRVSKCRCCFFDAVPRFGR